MRKTLIVGLLLSSSMAMAQQPAEYVIKITPQELDLVSKGLGTQPFNDVVPLINKLRAQVIEQQPKPTEAPKVEEKK